MVLGDKQKMRAAVTLGRRGGIARAKALSPAARIAIAHKAALARWDKVKPS